MTLGALAAEGVRLLVSCLDCRHQAVAIKPRSTLRSGSSARCGTCSTRRQSRSAENL